MLKLGLGLNNRQPAIGGGSSNLDAVVSSTVFELDATNSDSYSGSGETWSNLTASPADGESQTTYDFYLGETSGTDGSEPTFTGSAGDAGAYFSLDGSDAFAVSDWANAALFREFVRTDIAGGRWLSFMFTTDATIANGIDFIFGTGARSTADVGFNIMLNGTTGDLTFFVSDGTTRRSAVVSSGGISGSTDYCVTLSVEPSVDVLGTDNLRVWVNGVAVYADRFGWGTQETDPTEGGMALAAVFDEGAFFNHMANGTRAYAAAGGAEFLDNDSAIRSYFEAKHSRSYTD